MSRHPFPARCPEPRISQPRSKAEPREQPLFRDVCSLVQPATILEVGSWMGASAIAWAKAASHFKPEAVIYCVDTWLGSVEHYLSTHGEEWNIEKLSLGDYGPTFFDDFLCNIWDSGYQDRIIPFRADSSSALPFFAKEGLVFDVVYIDGAHDYHSVVRDISEGLNLVASKGVVCGDDFCWGSVRAALQHVAIRHATPLNLFAKHNDFVILDQANTDYAQKLLDLGYERWSPSQLRRSAHLLSSNLKGFVLQGLSA